MVANRLHFLKNSFNICSWSAKLHFFLVFLNFFFIFKFLFGTTFEYDTQPHKVSLFSFWSNLQWYIMSILSIFWKKLRKLYHWFGILNGWVWVFFCRKVKLSFRVRSNKWLKRSSGRIQHCCKGRKKIYIIQLGIIWQSSKTLWDFW